MRKRKYLHTFGPNTRQNALLAKKGKKIIMIVKWKKEKVLNLTFKPQQLKRFSISWIQFYLFYFSIGIIKKESKCSVKILILKPDAGWTDHKKRNRTEVETWR